jgi:hypothetical protein
VLSPSLNIQQNIPDFVNTSDATTQIKNFLVDVGYTTPPLNTWPCSPSLHMTYAFLPEEERKLFSSKPLTYITRQITLVPFPQIISNELLQLDIHNPITRLLIIPRRSDSILYRNNIHNFTNWWDYPTRPKIQTIVAGDSSFIESQNATGLLVPAGQPQIIRALRLLANGNEIQELKSEAFFTRITPFRYLDGGADRNLPVYSFELHSPSTQPSGSINASRLRRIQVDLQVFPLPLNSSYIYGVNVYVENLNFFLVESGTGDLKYAL